LNETGLENVSLVKEKTATTNQAVIVILLFCFSVMTAVISHDQSYQYLVDFA